MGFVHPAQLSPPLPPAFGGSPGPSPSAGSARRRPWRWWRSPRWASAGHPPGVLRADHGGAEVAVRWRSGGGQKLFFFGKPKVERMRWIKFQHQWHQYGWSDSEELSKVVRLGPAAVRWDACHKLHLGMVRNTAKCQGICKWSSPPPCLKMRGSMWYLEHVPKMCRTWIAMLYENKSHARPWAFPAANSLEASNHAWPREQALAKVL